MNSIFYSVIILLLLTGAILFLMWEVNKKRPGGKIVNLNQTEPMTKEEGEDHFSVLMNFGYLCGQGEAELAGENGCDFAKK